MRRLTLDYIGGLFDGEGSVSLLKKVGKPRSRQPGRLLDFSARLSLGQSDLGLLKAIVLITGGTIYLKIKGGTINKHGVKTNKDFYNIVWADREAERVGNLLLPHIHSKKKEVEALLKFREKHNNGTRTVTSIVPTKKQIKARASRDRDGLKTIEKLKTLRKTKIQRCPNGPA